jgi:hypothetical protein
MLRLGRLARLVTRHEMQAAGAMLATGPPWLDGLGFRSSQGCEANNHGQRPRYEEGPRGGHLREVAPVGGVVVKQTRTFSQTLSVGLSLGHHPKEVFKAAVSDFAARRWRNDVLAIQLISRSPLRVCPTPRTVRRLSAKAQTSRPASEHGVTCWRSGARHLSPVPGLCPSRSCAARVRCRVS